MKLSIFFLLLTLSFNVFSWEVVSKKDDFFLVSADKKSFTIISEGGEPSFLRVESLSPEFQRVVYRAGVAGTSELTEIHRALLMRKKDSKVLGDFAVSYEPLTNKKKKMEVRWILSKEMIVIEDPFTETSQKIDLR